MEGIKYLNLIEIGPVVIEIRRVENGKLTVPVNNTLVCHTAFLDADTRPYVLMVNYCCSSSCPKFHAFLKLAVCVTTIYNYYCSRIMFLDL